MGKVWREITLFPFPRSVWSSSEETLRSTCVSEATWCVGPADPVSRWVPVTPENQRTRHHSLEMMDSWITSRGELGATPAQLSYSLKNHPDRTTGSLLSRGGSLWHKDKWILCKEWIHYRRPYVLKKQQKARNAYLAVSLWHKRAGSNIMIGAWSSMLALTLVSTDWITGS